MIRASFVSSLVALGPLAASLLAAPSFAQSVTSAQVASPASVSSSAQALLRDGCGMTDVDVTYRDLQVGDVVTLQRHRWVRGEANWRDEMIRYLGRAARVTRLSGVDGQGCAGVRVDVDHEQYFWRVRDLGIGTAHQPEALEAASTQPFPDGCGMSEGAEQYGSARVGTQVIVGRHRMIDGDDNWAEDMEAFVGRTARITDLIGGDGQGCPGVRLDIDGGEWFWRLNALRPVGETTSADAYSPPPSAGVTTDHGRPSVSSSGGSGLFGGESTLGAQACGQTDANVRWEGLNVGAEVVLGRHRPVGGDTNWSAEMDAFVGRSARVTELVGTDSEGCAIVRVDVDQGQWVWRTRDLTVTSLGSGPAPAAPAEEISIAPSFAPDPMVRMVSAGGTVRGSEMRVTGSSCTYASYPSAPQLVVTLTTPQPGLRFLTHSGSVDSALAVRMPNGQVLCDDDGGENLDAALDMPGLPGRYEIFVGTWNRAAAGSIVTFAITSRRDVFTDALPEPIAVPSAPPGTPPPGIRREIPAPPPSP